MAPQVCGEDVSRGKPAPDAFLLAASKLGIPPEHCVGYEDAKLGMEAIEVRCVSMGCLL